MTKVKKTVLFFTIIFQFIAMRSFCNDTSNLKKSQLKTKNFYIGILLAPAYLGGYEQKSLGKKSGHIPFLYNLGSIFSEYTILNRYSVFAGFSYGYNYFRDTINVGSLGGTCGLRYNIPLTTKKKKEENKPTLLYAQIGLGYTKGYYYNAPNLIRINRQIECFGLNLGVSFIPSKLFKKANSNFIIYYSVVKPFYNVKNKEDQFFGGFGIKYKI